MSSVETPTVGCVIPRSTLTPPSTVIGGVGSGAVFYELHLRVSPPGLSPGLSAVSPGSSSVPTTPLEFVVYHRYSEFLTLHQSLIGTTTDTNPTAACGITGVMVPNDIKENLESTFPPKILIANTSEYMDARMESLEQWIHIIVDYFNGPTCSSLASTSIIKFFELDLKYFKGDSETITIADYYVDADPQQQVDYWNYVESERRKEREKDFKRDRCWGAIVKQGSIFMAVNGTVMVALVKIEWIDLERLTELFSWWWFQASAVCWGDGTCVAPGGGEATKKVGVTSWEKEGEGFEFCAKDVKQIVLVLHVLMAVSMFVKDKLI